VQKRINRAVQVIETEEQETPALPSFCKTVHRKASCLKEGTSFAHKTALFRRSFP
jgi:hypothetical protein